MNLEKKQLIKVVVISTTICLLFALVLFLPIFKVVAFEYENSEEMLAYFRVEDHKRFEILYTHSIHLTPVLESYLIDENNNIVQTDLVYEHFAVGMPSNAHEGEKFVIENGKYHIKNMSRSFPFIDLRVGQVVANHQLLLDDKKIPFKSFVEPGTWVRIDVEKKALWQLMKGVDVDEYGSS